MEDYKKKYKEALKRAKGFKTDEYKDVAEYIFPELRESEDERIRKALISFLKSPFVNESIADEKVTPWIAWLEKPCEQKPNDKVEPKFKAGDKVISTISNIPYYITEVCNGYYLTDVGCIIMFNAQDNFELVEQKPAWSEEDELIISVINSLINMAETKTGQWYYNGFKKVFYFDIRQWLKSLKDRVKPQQKWEWSEEDKQMIEDIIEAIDTDYAASDYHEMVDWLKSLKPQNTWKPSDEQIKVLLSEVEGWTKGCPKQKVLESLFNDLKEL